MRLYPPASALPRQALHDVEITSEKDPSASFFLRKHTSFLINIYGMHRDSEIFPQPEVFDPDRFSLERERLIPRYAYLPFGAGPRICIGNHFALLEGHLIIAALAQRVEFTLLPSQNLAPSSSTLITRPEEQVKVIVRKRG